MDRGAWGATAHGVAESLTQLSDSHTHTYITTCKADSQWELNAWRRAPKAGAP